jgi:adenylate cyclase
VIRRSGRHPRLVARTFVFADLAGYTALTEAHGDDAAVQIAIAIHELAQRCLPAGARVVKTSVTP